MSNKDRHTLPREVSTARALTIASLISLAAGLGFLIAATLLAGVWQTLMYSISSTVLSIGLISFLYELWLRRTVEAELLRLVGIERSLASHHLLSARDASRIDWNTMLVEASNFRILLAEPGGWVNTNWSSIVEGGRDRPIHVELFFPDPEGERFSHVADFYDVSEVYLAEDIERASRIAEDQWKIASGIGALSPGSKLQVRRINAFPSCSVVRADNKVTITYFSSTSRPSTDSGFALTFGGSSSAYPIKGYDEELDRLSSGNPSYYENEVDGKRNKS